MTLSEYCAQYKDINLFILPSDVTIEIAGPDLILYYTDEAKNRAFLQTIPRDNKMYHFFVKDGARYTYLGGRYFNNIDIEHKCIIEGHGWEPTLKACEDVE